MRKIPVTPSVSTNAGRSSSRLAKLRQTLKRPPWRTVVPAVSFLLLVLLARAVWTPGRVVTDGRHDLRNNAIWMQHGWIGHNSWFVENNRMHRLKFFRDPQSIKNLAQQMRKQHIRDVFPHLCPTQLSGAIMPVDDAQTSRFLSEFHDFRVLPWIGGVIDADVTPDLPKRRKVFVQSAAALLKRHPRLAGVHLNVEPWPSGHGNMLLLLDELRKALPPGKVLSVAAYPPPTYWHPFPEVHWEEKYFQEVAKRVDQMAVMMYDTALKDSKLYQHVMRSWTQQQLDWTAGLKKPPQILMGVPTYSDYGVGYHNPEVENLDNALRGVHAGLGRYDKLPAHYQGTAIYSEWVTGEDEWRHWERFFRKP